MGIAAVDTHARRSRRKGGSNGKYRAIVLCPDHLVGKWCREIRETIPDAAVTRFGPQGDIKVSLKKKRGKGEKALADESNTRKSLRDTLALMAYGETRHKDVAGSFPESIAAGCAGERWAGLLGAAA